MLTIRPHCIRGCTVPRCGPLALAVLLLAAGCGGRDEEVESSFAGTVPIGEGQEVYVRCVGEGSPTVVFESGDESSAGQWDLVLPAVGERTTACAYDRLGVDRSSPAAGCRGMTELLDVVEAVLHELRVEPPIVMVGTSGGGYLAVGYALAHPGDVAGLVLADTPPCCRSDEGNTRALAGPAL